MKARSELSNDPLPPADASVSAQPSPPPYPSAQQRSALARWVLGALLALAVAAALLSWSSSSERPRTAASAALAPYQLELQGSIGAQPSSGFDIAGSPLVLLLRPDGPSGQAIVARAYLRTPNALTPLAHRLEAAPGGALRLTAAAETRWPERGDIVIWVGAANREPEPDELAASAPEAGPGWQRLERPFVRRTAQLK